MSETIAEKVAYYRAKHREWQQMGPGDRYEQHDAIGVLFRALDAERERAERAEAQNARLVAMEEELIETFSYLGAGLPDQATHVRSRIEWAVDHHVSVAIQRAADVVERLSQAPAPFRTWGQVKTEILSLKPAAQTLKDRKDVG